MIPAIVLAAGQSSRMGRLKATLPLGGETFLTRVVRTLLSAGIDDVVVVVGHEKDILADALVKSGLPARLVENPDYLQGQFSSLLAGLHVVDRPGVVATLVTLVDVPLVSSATVREVVECYRRTGSPIVRPTRGADHGHPLLIARSLFDVVRRADPADGAKSVVRAHATPDGDITVDDVGAFLDIDTPGDYENMLHLSSDEPTRGHG